MAFVIRLISVFLCVTFSSSAMQKAPDDIVKTDHLLHVPNDVLGCIILSVYKSIQREASDKGFASHGIAYRAIDPLFFLNKKCNSPEFFDKFMRMLMVHYGLSITVLALECNTKKTLNWLQNFINDSENPIRKKNAQEIFWSSVHSSSDQKIVLTLLKCGLTLHIKNDAQETPLMRATKFCNDVQQMRFLLTHGAKTTIDWQDEDGNTALIHAIKERTKSKEKVELLIKYGADQRIKNNHQMNALMYAHAFYAHTDIIDLLHMNEPRLEFKEAKINSFEAKIKEEEDYKRQKRRLEYVRNRK